MPRVELQPFHAEPDNFDKHIKDTLIAGDGLCNRKVVEMVVKEGPAQISNC